MSFFGGRDSKLRPLDGASLGGRLPRAGLPRGDVCGLLLLDSNAALHCFLGTIEGVGRIGLEYGDVEARSEG